MDIKSILNSTGPPLDANIPNSYVVIPSIFFWLVVPSIVHECKSSRLVALPWSILMSLKWLAACVMILDRFSVFSLAVWETLIEKKSIGTEKFIYPFLHTITLLSLLVAMNELRRAGIHSSGKLFCTWMFFAIFAVPEFYRWVVDRNQPDHVADVDTFRYVAYLTYFPLVLAEFVFHSVSDPFPMPESYQRINCPEENASFISRVFLSWYTRIISLGSKRPLDVDDVFDLDSELDRTSLKSQWKVEWEKQKQNIGNQKSKAARNNRTSGRHGENESLLGSNKNYGSVHDGCGDENKTNQPSVVKTLWILLRWDLIGAFTVKFLADVLNFSDPLFLNLLITYIETPESPTYVGIALAIGLFIAGQLKSLLINNYFIQMTRIGTKIQTVLSCAVYEKVLRLSNSARRERTVGEMVNIVAIDVERFRLIMPQLQQYWSSPLQVIVCMVLLWKIVGVAVWAGVLVMISIVPLNFAVSVWTKKYQVKLMKYKDERIRLTNEVLNGIKVVKLSAWETAMEESIGEVRDKELDMIQKSTLLKTIADCLNVAAPVFVALATFTVFTLISSDNILTPSIAFVSLSLFNLLRGPLMMAADLVSQSVQIVVSNQRIRTFLCEEECDNAAIKRTNDKKEHSTTIEVNSGLFSWDKTNLKTLSNVDFKIKNKELIMVVGSVGSGKSSLLLAILGEMEKLGGYVGIHGSVAYLSQQPWILNQSLKKNILMQNDMDETVYKKIVENCALSADFEQLADGDETEIGEKGINLSGGQKARISLARAVYQNKNVYFLDDPLSAVDSHVGKHIFENVIGHNGILSKTTRIMVTNSTTFLHESNRIVIMKDGKIHFFDTYDNLMKNEEAQQYLNKVEDESQGESDASDESSKHEDEDSAKTSRLSSSSRKKSHSSVVAKPKSKAPNVLIAKEEAASGKVQFNIYMLYFKAMGIFRYVLPYLVVAVLNFVFSIGRSFWLTAWSDANVDPTQPDQMSSGLRLGIFSAIGILETVSLFASLALLLFGGVAASRNLHRPLLHNVLRNPLSYFDVTPIGRIINRLAKDMEVVDLRLTTSFRYLVMAFINILQTTIIVTYTTQPFILVIIPCFIVYYYVLKLSIKSTRQLQRIASLTRSPIFSNFSETLQGISTIRAFQWNDEFIKKNDERLDVSLKCSYYSLMANRWLSIRLELLGSIITFGASIFAIMGKEWGMTAGLLGLSVSASLSVQSMMNLFLRQINEVETSIVSVERIDEYTKTESEAEWRSNSPPSPKWPHGGAVNIDQYSCRYRDGLDLVLKEINLNILRGQKVGVCGRTGAGKSSLALAMFRIVEAAEGTIEIDKTNTARIGLHDLRERLTIIPQENVLFANTLRFNIDPKNEFSDDHLWTALENSNLRDHVETLPLKLESPVAEGGENFSVGQRQLLCLTRALLKKSKVLLLDEATAGIDNRTDALVQATIREKFAESTIICIAHRLNTIIDYDRIIVMEEGRIVEDGIPGELLKDKNSKFYGLAKSAKIV